MTAWQMHIQARAPSLSMTAHSGLQTKVIKAAVDASVLIDAAMGLKLNAPKCELFYKCSGAQLRSFRCWNVCSGRQWCVTKQFKLLGVHYCASRARRVPIEPRVIAKVKARL